MRLYLIFLVLGLSYASNSPAWKDDMEYLYLVNGRALTSLDESSKHYSGFLVKAKMLITPFSDGKLQATLKDIQLVEINRHLPDGWDTYIEESDLNYKHINSSEKPFQIIQEKGVIKSLIVEKGTTNYEANIIKGGISHFQLDVQGKNVIPSKFNMVPKDDRFEGVFKTMEETVTGETETSYEIHPLPEYLIQSQPWLLPQPQLKSEGPVTEIIKNKNFTDSGEIPFYHFGFSELVQDEPASNKLGELFIRQSNSRIILTGKPSRHTIQNIQTFHKIMINLPLNAKEQGSLITTTNFTLYQVKTKTEKPQELADPVDIGNLLYTYENPFSGENKVHEKQQAKRYIKGISLKNILNSIYKSSPAQQDDKISLNSEDIPSNLSPQDKMKYQSKPKMSEAPRFPLLPYFMGDQGSSIKMNGTFDLKTQVETTAKELAVEIPEPETVLVRSTLSRYLILCSLVRLMSEQEITDVTERLYTESKHGPECYAWRAFRDAIADAGTGPAFLNIQKWIESGKIENEEATEIVTSMGNSVRVPTEEYMRKFFELIKSPEITHREGLNETTLLVFTRLVNKVYINKKESHHQFPVHSFGSFNTIEGREWVKSEVLPYLTQQLHEAVSKADSRHIHVYVRALGNVAHRKILEAFEPYLEGRRQVSQFQRMLMVLSMDKLVVSEPVIAQNVLYRIYSNEAEIPEVRVLAVHQLMRTVPPAEMIQRMAENTNTDPQESVNAAVKSVIESASQLRKPEARILRTSAESAKPFLTKKEYSKRQSFNLLQDFVVENMDLDFKHNLLQVGSSDHNLPKGLKYSVRGNINGLKHYFFNIQTMISSIKELTNVFSQQTQEDHGKQDQQYKEHEFSSAKIAEYLKLETNEREQLEGFIYAEIEQLQKMWSFDNETLKQLPQVIREKEEKLKNGHEFSYVKLKQLKELTLAFPTEMGIPFLYTYELPLLVQFEGKIKAVADPKISRDNKLHMPKHLNGEFETFVTVTTKAQSQLSVVTPLDHQMYISGFDQHAQVHLDLVGKVNIELENNTSRTKLEIELQEKHDHPRLMHFSSWPYTSKSDVMNFDPVALRPNTKRLRPKSNTHRSFDFTVGREQTGMSFRVWGHYPPQTINILQLDNLVKSDRMATAWQELWDISSLQQTEANIAYMPNQSEAQKLIVSLRQTNQYQGQGKTTRNENKGFWAMDQFSARVEPDREKRQKNILKYVASDIINAQLYFFDMSVDFIGDKKYEHTFTLSSAKSNVDPQSRIIMFYENNVENSKSVSLQIKGNKPKVNELDVNYLMHTKLKAMYEILFQYGVNEEQSSKVKATLDLIRSETRKRYLEEKPLIKICRRQMQKGNYQLAACQIMTPESKYLDDIKINLHYENLLETEKNWIANIFKGSRFFLYPNYEVRSIKSEGQNNVNLRIRFEPQHLRQVNVSVRVHDEETKLYNLSISEIRDKTICVKHPVSHLLSQLIGNENIEATCILDHTYGQTFGNLTYPLSLGEKWSLMMMYVPQEARFDGETYQLAPQKLRNQKENVAVLVRELSVEEREVKVTFSHPKTEGKLVDINMKFKKPGRKPVAAILIDGKEAATELFDGYVEVYALPNGELKLKIQNWFSIVFDGNRVKLTTTSSKLRDSTVGLCGRFSEDKYEDFWIPNNCIIKSSERFVQSYILGDTQLQQEEEYQDCVPKVLPLYTDVISNLDVEIQENWQERSSSDSSLKHLYFEENGKVCFTKYPVPVCKHSSRNTITKNIPVHCMSKTDSALDLMNKIDKGLKPDFSTSSTTKTMQHEMPTQCN